MLYFKEKNRALFKNEDVEDKCYPFGFSTDCRKWIVFTEKYI
jgi:hypothetical protein